MDIQKERQAFIEYLQIEKNASSNTIQFYEYDLNAFLEFLNKEGITSLFDVDYAVIRIFLTELYDRQLSRRSVSRKLSSLRMFYRFLEREGKIEFNPFLNISLPKMNKPIPEFLYEEELEKLFHVSDLNTSLGKRNQAILELLYATGMRVSECVKLSIENIDFSLGTLLVQGKGRKERYVPFGSFAQEALSDYISNGRNKLLAKSNHATQHVFLNAKGTPLTDRGVRKVLDQMVQKAALTIHLHPHKLRHTFATHMLNEGADLRSVQELLGHEHLSSTQIYTHVTKDHLRKIYNNSHPRA
ncbi:tyrosine recombinase XerC [Pontibacillus yanchengensis]|uniref:Tyrosine recombinase XerC n=2 Tax=Pontibacillus yanchengensis TaxID=462910 RepID=A0ACC7VA01_9BACI|nr:tyrosine recombinase XerC [Pontibacillus yanchengensis]MYL33132.1 tyrosine recombinase XerC [Pontibacillus yanchengensis]MYL52018.1 tyrosine recombinase XerC [Pontibacillus yanchengensis]